jgi:addiction module HigA family antidote
VDKILGMKNPPHPGRLLRDDIDALELSVAQAAKALGVTRSQLYRVLGGECAVSPEMAIRLECVIGGSAEHWLRMQAAYDTVQIRKRSGEITQGLTRIEMPAH